MNRQYSMALALVVIANAAARADNFAFRSPTVTEQTVTVQSDKKHIVTVVCFLGTECPMARIYASRLSEMAERNKNRSVRFIGVDSNRQDSALEVRQFATALNLRFPMIHDAGGVIADQYSASRTPEVFVLDESLKLRYQGRIDDQYEPGVNRAHPKRHDLQIAIDELLSGHSVSVPETEATGCIIGRSQSSHASQAGSVTSTADNDVTYFKDVAPVLQQHCMECHRRGDIGPFAMDNYEDVAGWAFAMLETIDNGRMPPWHASPDHGQFLNARHMPDEDRQVIRDWIAGGLKSGDAADQPITQPYVDGWQLEREPDQVIEMRDRPFVVPANGVVEYQYFVADPGFDKDVWVTGAQVIPGSRAVVHHAIAFVRPPDGSRFRGLGWLSAYVPGQRLPQMPLGHARFVPAGSKIVFQMHYTPNGTQQLDMTRIGLLFGDEPQVTHEVLTLVALNQEFEIPPAANEHAVTAAVSWMPEDGHLLAATPHMHYRGKSFRLFATEDDSQILLDVPGYDFNWQHTYSFAEPIPIANLEKLRFKATFDNSAANPFNPDPTEWVTWGDQTWQEMAVAFFEVAEPRTKSGRKKKSLTVGGNRAADRQARIDAYVVKCMSELDKNQDDRITRDEAPIVIRHFYFKGVDKDRNGTITREEVRKAAERRY